MLLVANDIVDLMISGAAEKPGNPRFVSRVFTVQEQDLIAGSSLPDRMLWILWAAKEAAFKIVSKMSADAIFAHQRFETSLGNFSESEDACFYARACTVHQNLGVNIEISGTREYVHAVAIHGQGEEEADGEVVSNCRAFDDSEFKRWEEKPCLREHFTEEECLSIHRGESALARHCLKAELAGRLRRPYRDLNIIRPVEGDRNRPPFLLIRESRAKIDIGLSHHGKWIAWVYGIPGGR